MRKQRRSSFFSYFRLAARRAWHEGKNFFVEQVVIAIALLLVATWLNIRMGYMQFSEGRHSLYVALLTYGCFTLLYLGYLIFRSGWLVDEDRLEEIAAKDEELGRATSEIRGLLAFTEADPHVVVEFNRGSLPFPAKQKFTGERPVCLTNIGQRTAYAVQIEAVETDIGKAVFSEINMIEPGESVETRPELQLPEGEQFSGVAEFETFLQESQICQPGTIADHKDLVVPLEIRYRNDVCSKRIETHCEVVFSFPGTTQVRDIRFTCSSAA